MKKFLAIALSVLMLVGIMPLAAYAAEEPDFVFDFEASTTEVRPGDIVDITVSVTGSENAASGGWQFELLLPEGVEYVANSGAIDPALKSTISATDDCSFTETSKIVVCVGTDGLTNLNQKNKILTFQVTVNDDVVPGQELEIAAYDWTVMDADCDELAADKYELNYVTLKVAPPDPDFVFDFEASKTNVVAGEIVDITVSVTGTENAASGGWQFELLLPEEAEYVANSGAIDPALKSTISATDDCSFTESSKIVVCVGTDGLTNLNQKNVILTFQVKVADDVTVGDEIEIAAYDWTVMDANCDELPVEAYRTNYATLTVVDHICSADKLTYVEAVEATCTEDGNIAYYVCECSLKYTDADATEFVADVIVPATGHVKSDVVIENEVDADCVNEGSYDEVVYCEVCGEELARTPFTSDALGHTEMEAVVENEVAADCVNEGSYDSVIYCSVCDAEVSRETIIVDALGHTAGEVVVENEVAPDCENEGSYDEVVYCSVCGEELSRETITVDALGHDYEAEVTAPTCLEGGYTTYTCACGDSYVADETDALGHTEGEVVYENVSDATCTEGGTGDAVIYCSVCGEELSRITSTVPALGHTEAEAVVENEVDADCVNDGSYDEVVYCEVCGEEVSRETIVIDALGHTEAEAVVENEVDADCVNEGSYDEVVYCEVCGEELSRETIVIDALGHTEAEAVVENEVDADCVNEGSYDEVVYCEVCGEELSRETTTIDALGHTEAEAVEENRVEATCTEDGSYDMVVYCSVCGEELSRETTTIDALGHEYAEVVTAPTCTEAGYTTYTCSCGDSYVADETDALGHTEGEWVADATVRGQWNLLCSVCGEILDTEMRAVNPTGIKLDQTNVTTWYIRKAPAFTLTETVLPEDQALLDYEVIWTSSDESIVTVDEDGNVTTHKRGTATITATLVDADGNEISSAKCEVKVKYTWWQWLIWLFLLGCCWYFV